ncbi:uncharacterized protein AB9W97_005843 isoform 1-T1 [Spinachia spinachia]
MFLFFTSLRRQTNTDKLTATVAILRLFPNFIKEPFASLEEGILNSNDPAGGLKPRRKRCGFDGKRKKQAPSGRKIRRWNKRRLGTLDDRSMVLPCTRGRRQYCQMEPWSASSWEPQCRMGNLDPTLWPQFVQDKNNCLELETHCMFLMHLHPNE